MKLTMKFVASFSSGALNNFKLEGELEEPAARRVPLLLLAMNLSDHTTLNCACTGFNLVVRKETPGPPKTGFEFYSSLVAHFIINISTQMLTITW